MILKKAEVDVLLLFNQAEKIDPNFVYMTHEKSGGVYFCTQDEDIIYTSPLEYANFSRTCVTDVVQLSDVVPVLQGKLQGKKVGLNFSTVSVKEFEHLQKKFPHTQFQDVSGIFSQVRAVKDADELTLIKKSCQYADQVMAFAIERASKDLSEIALQRMIDHQIEAMDLEQAFPTIVATGTNAGCPHHISGKEKLKGFTVIDLGVIYKHYCSDMTRTLYVGKPTSEEKKLYAMVQGIQEQCVRAVAEGIQCRALHMMAQEVLGKPFVHSLGHGLGIQVHEAPAVSEKSTDVLVNNNVITIEPGYYTEKLGIRIEDEVLVEKKGVLLTKTTRELVSV